MPEIEFPPKKITIKSDQNVLTFVETIKTPGAKELFYEYKYTKSITKKGKTVRLNEKDLNKLIRNNET